jgi:hypothetical protein
MMGRTVLAWVLLPLLPLHSVAAPSDGPDKRVAKPASFEYYAPFLINNLFTLVGNNGGTAYSPWNWDIPGAEFPKGSGHSVLYAEGTIWGGFHNGQASPKIGGSEYRHALRPGRIVTSGTPAALPVPDDSSLAKYRVYRTRPDIRPGAPRTAAIDAELNTESALISRHRRMTPQDVYDRYMLDWQEWPAADGAPFDDVNGDGRYNPSIDIPGVAGADQTLWYVANDADVYVANRICGAAPIGIEMQKTVWGYRRPGPLSGTCFIRTRIINRSGSTVDSMYVGQWSDPDVGWASDDRVGFDRILGLAFAYNGARQDQVYGTAVPATGFLVLSGPAVKSAASDSAIIGLQVRRGVRSLIPSAFIMNTGAVPEYADPVSSPPGRDQWYCQLRGYSALGCAPMTDPTTGQVSTFYATGDPVLGSGWLDGVFVGPADRRMMVSMGPFTFAAGDTQEIVVAHVTAQAGDPVTSVRLLKESAQDIRRAYADLLRPVPSCAVTAGWPGSGQARVAVSVDARVVPILNPVAVIVSEDGVSTIGWTQLYDDGLHGDGAANDLVYRGSVDMPASLAPVRVDLQFTDAQNTARVITVAAALTVAGGLEIAGPDVFSENLYADGKVNPGENIRFGVRLTNQTGFTLRKLSLLHSFGKPADVLPLSLAPGAMWANAYDGSDQSTFITLDAPAFTSGTSFDLPVILGDSAGNSWYDTLRFAAAPSRYTPVLDTAAVRQAMGHGSFGIMVVDRKALRSHRYVLTAQAPLIPGGDVVFRLEDSCDGRILFDRHTLPDSLGHDVPLTDGFKIVRGDVAFPGGQLRGWSSGGTGRMWSSFFRTGLGLEGFFGEMGNAFDHWPSGGVGYERHRNVVVTFAPTDSSGTVIDPSGPNCSFAYRYLQNADKPAAVSSFAPYIVRSGPGMQYQDYTTVVPFTAFDIDTIPARRLMVGFLENNVPVGTVNGRYWPPVADPYGKTDNTSDTSAREWFFIFDRRYGIVPLPELQVDLASSWTPMMWFGNPARLEYHQIPRERDTFMIHTWLPPRAGDRWTFDPVASAGGLDATIPSAFEVFPNYPNPFNAGTTIKFALPEDMRITVRVFNILGQQVRSLEDGVMPEGYRTSYWDGRNDRGEQVGSGVYIYRLESVRPGNSSPASIRVGKMIMLR